MKNAKKIVILSFITAIICATPINAMLPQAARRIGGNILIRAMQTSPQCTGVKFQPHLIKQAKSRTILTIPKNSTPPRMQFALLKKTPWLLLGTAGALGYTLSNQEKAHAQDGTDCSVEYLKKNPNEITFKVIEDLSHGYGDCFLSYKEVEVRNKLKSLVEDTTTASTIIQLVIQNVNKVPSNLLTLIIKYNPEFHKIMKHDPDAVEIFTKAAAKNIIEMSPNELLIIIDSNPDAAKIFIKAAAENITEINGWTLETFMKHDPNAAEIFTEAAAKNITKMSEWTLRDIMEHNSNAAKIFTKAAAKNITKMSPDTLLTMINSNPNVTKMFTEPAAQNITKMNDDVLCEIMRYNCDAAKIFTEPAVQNITKMDGDVLEEIMEYNPDAARIFREAKALLRETSAKH